MFLLGVLAGGAGNPLGWALAAGGVAWAGSVLRVRVGAWAALAVLLASLFAGVARRGEVPTFAPRPRVTPDVARVRGTVERGCVDRGEFSVCEVSLDARRVELHTPRGACAAAPGDTIEALVTLRPVQPTLNGARAGPGAALVRRGIETIAESTQCEITGRSRGVLREIRRVGHWLRGVLGDGITRAVGAAGAARARALLFGDESGLASVDGDAFRRSGLAHLLAVSGAHVALLASALGALATALLRRWRRVAERGRIHAVATVLPLAPVVCFIVATGESASARRALVAALCATIARLAGRRARAEPLVAASLLVTLGLEPSCAFDPGWQLSIVAAWALAASRDERPVTASMARAVLAFFLESLRASARVAVAAAPVLAWQFQRVPLSALAANALAAPLAEAIGLPLVLTAGFSGALPRPVARGLGYVTSVILEALFAMPHLALRLPGATAVVPTPTPAQCVVLTAAAIVGMRAGWRVRAWLVLAAAIAVFAIEVPHVRASRPHGVLRVTAIDVGQGDALLVDLPDGEAMLVDGGGGFSGFDPGARIVVPALADRRRRSLVAVIASHPHPDHIGGLAAVLAWATSVEALWDTRQGEAFDDANGAYGAMRSMAARRGIRVRGPEALCGPPRAFHGALLEVLAPCPAVPDGARPNDGSFVLRIRLGRAVLLLPGDLEALGEARIADMLGPVTVLKVGHHGSRTSSSDDFLDRIRPQIAIVSAGHPSPFGHPHAVVLERFHARGIPLWSTAERGAVSVTLFPDGRAEATTGAF